MKSTPMSGKIKDPDPPPNCLWFCTSNESKLEPVPKSKIYVWILDFGFSTLDFVEVYQEHADLGRQIHGSNFNFFLVCFFYDSIAEGLQAAWKLELMARRRRQGKRRTLEGLVTTSTHAWELKATPNMLTESRIVDLCKPMDFGTQTVLRHGHILQDVATCDSFLETETPIRCQLCFGYRRFSWPHPR